MITFSAVLSQSGCKLIEEDQNKILIQCRPKCNAELTLVRRRRAEKTQILRTKDVIPKLSVRLAI